MGAHNALQQPNWGSPSDLISQLHALNAQAAAQHKRGLQLNDPSLGLQPSATGEPCSCRGPALPASHVNTQILKLLSFWTTRSNSVQSSLSTRRHGAGGPLPAEAADASAGPTALAAPKQPAGVQLPPPCSPPPQQTLLQPAALPPTRPQLLDPACPAALGSPMPLKPHAHVLPDRAHQPRPAQAPVPFRFRPTFRFGPTPAVTASPMRATARGGGGGGYREQAGLMIPVSCQPPTATSSNRAGLRPLDEEPDLEMAGEASC